MMRSNIHQSNHELPYLFGDLNTVSSVWFTLTNRCNIHCKYCFNYIEKDNEEMPADLAVAILESTWNTYKINNDKPLRIIFFGGEPTLNEAALFSMLDFTKKNKVKCDLILMTNGIIKSSVLDHLLETDVQFQISFDGFKNNIRLSKSGKNNTIISTVKTIERVSKNNIPIVLRVTIHEGNVTSMSDIVQFCADYQIGSVAFAPICMFGDALLNGVKQPLVDIYVAELIKAIDLADHLKVNVKNKSFCYNESSEKHIVPFVWLPDGSLAMTITYASAKNKDAHTILIGKYDLINHKIILDDKKIKQMNANFLKNRNKYCHGCSIESNCKGFSNFSAYATDTFISEREGFFCDLVRKITHQFGNNKTGE